MTYGDPRALFKLFDLSMIDEPIPTTYVAVVGQFERGPMFKGVAVKGGQEDKLIETFGNSVAWSNDPLACKNAIKNGANLVIHRIGHCTDIQDRSTLDILSASVLIPDRGGQPTAGSVTSDVGPFTFQQALSGRVTGLEIGPFTIVAGANDQFKVRVGTPGNWGADQTVTLTEGTDSTQQVCDDVNAGTTGINAVPTTDGKFYCEAVNVGDDVEILTVANDCYSALGLTEAVASHVEGEDSLVLSIDGGADQTFDLEPNGSETGAFDLTAAEVALQIASILGATASTSGGALVITSDTTGVSSSVQIKATSTCATNLGFDTDAHSGTAGVVKYPWKFELIGPGAYGNGAKVYVYDAPLNSGEAVNVRITVPGGPEEYFKELSRDPDDARYWKTYINSHSDHGKIVDVDTPNDAPYDWPALSSDGYTLAGGDDGTLLLTDADWVGDAAGKTGFYCTDHWQIPFIDIMLFGTSSPVVRGELNTFIAGRKGRLGWSPTPPGLNASETAAWRMGDPTEGWSHAAFNTHEGAILRGHPEIFDSKNNALEEVTALSFLAPSICETDEAHGHHWSPFGVKRGGCSGVQGLDDNPAENQADADLLAEYQINNCRIFHTDVLHRGWEGAYNWGGWTLQRAMSALREVPVVRKIKWYEWMMYPIGLSFINDPNHPVIWGEVHRTLEPILRQDLEKFAIYGYVLITDRDAFFTAEGELKGAVLNTGRDIDQGIYRCRILIQPVRQIFYFIIEMGVMRTGEPFVNYSTMYALPGWVRQAA